MRDFQEFINRFNSSNSQALETYHAVDKLLP